MVKLGAAGKVVPDAKAGEIQASKILSRNVIFGALVTIKSHYELCSTHQGKKMSRIVTCGSKLFLGNF
jgi:hypothetical protein